MTRLFTARSSYAAFGLAAMLLLGCAGGAAQEDDTTESAETTHNVRTLKLMRTTLEETLTITGRVRAMRATDISAEEGGVVASITSEKGALLGQGDVIIELDRKLLAAEMKAAEAAMILRQYNAERTRSLLDANSVSKQEMLIVHTEQEQATQNYEVARLRHGRALVRAPFDGVVAERYVELGQLVAPGMRVARMIDPYALKLVGWVTEREVASLRLGAPALVSFDGSEELASARISWIGVEASPTNGKISVELRIENPELRYRAGVIGRARVERQRHEQAVVIPRDSVVNGPKGPAVYVVDGDRASRRDVRLGADQGMMVIVEAGLDAGVTLVVRGQRELSEGARVRIQERSESRDGSIEGDPDEVREWVNPAAEFGGGR